MEIHDILGKKLRYPKNFTVKCRNFRNIKRKIKNIISKKILNNFENILQKFLKRFGGNFLDFEENWDEPEKLDNFETILLKF